MKRYHFEIPGLPKITANGSHGHWATKAKERKRWRRDSAAVFLTEKPVAIYRRVQATFIRHSSNEPDSDNLAGSFKPIRDALVDSGFIADDKSQYITAIYLWQPAKRGKGFITIKLEALT